MKRSKLKFDRQIVAIAKVQNVSTIYSDDEDIEKLGKTNGITVINVAELPMPPPKQSLMFEGVPASVPSEPPTPI